MKRESELTCADFVLGQVKDRHFYGRSITLIERGNRVQSEGSFSRSKRKKSLEFGSGS